MSKIYNYLYQTTNLINNKIYVGKRSTNISPVDDSYLGSGKLLWNAINKYGKTSFKKEILALYSSLEELTKAEKEYVNEEFLQRADVYNLRPGGDGGNTTIRYTQEQKKEVANKVRDTRKKNGKKVSPEALRRMRISAKKRVKEKPHTLPDNRGRVFSASALSRIREAAVRKRGETWVTDGIESKKIKPGIILPDGWFKGRPPSVPRFKEHSVISKQKISQKLTGSVCYTDGNVNCWVKPGAAIPEGYYKGMTKKVHKHVCINNEIQEKHIGKTDTLPDGWKFGRILRFWVTDGIDNKSIPVTNKVPDGWFKGRTPKLKKNSV